MIELVNKIRDRREQLIATAKCLTAGRKKPRCLNKVSKARSRLQMCALEEDFGGGPDRDELHEAG